MNKSKRYKTVGEKLLWSYANLAMAHAAVEANADRYGPRWYQIRNFMWTRFNSGDVAPRALIDDEKAKVTAKAACIYCGTESDLTADHLIPTAKGGPDVGDNLVCACGPCNSSKNASDLMAWYRGRESFPPLMVLRRYLKQCIKIAKTADAWDIEVDKGDSLGLPFSIEHIPTKFPPPKDLQL